MKTAIWTSYHYELSPEQAIYELSKSGIRYTELSDEHALVLLERGDPAVVGAEFKKYADQMGVKIPQGHLWLGVKLVADDNAVSVLKKWIDLFRAIGIKRGVLHCDAMKDVDIPYKQKLLRNVEKIKELVDYIKGTDFIICLENLCSIVPSVEDLLYIIKKVGGRNLGICLDTGHLNLVGGNQRDFILKAGRKLKALHIADNEGAVDQHMMPFGKGTVNIKEVFATLKEIGYKGIYNLEIGGERRCPVEIRRFKAQYIKKSFEYLDRVVSEE